MRVKATRIGHYLTVENKDRGVTAGQIRFRFAVEPISDDPDKRAEEELAIEQIHQDARIELVKVKPDPAYNNPLDTKYEGCIFKVTTDHFGALREGDSVELELNGRGFLNTPHLTPEQINERLEAQKVAREELARKTASALAYQNAGVSKLIFQL